MAEKPYHDAERIRELYHDRGLNQSDIAEKFGCSRTTIAKWMDKHGVETRPPVRTISDKRLYDGSWLREKYYDEQMSAGEIADELGCEKSAVYGQMDKRDMERRSKEEGAAMYHRNEWAGYYVRPNGYVMTRAKVNRQEVAVGIHRLIAISDGADPYEIFGGKHVHHKNGIPWDNRSENLEVVSNSDHISKHVEGAERAESGEILAHKPTESS